VAPTSQRSGVVACISIIGMAIASTPGNPTSTILNGSRS
jgi:hypothetical protein